MSSSGGMDLDRLSGAELLEVLRAQERIKHQAELVEVAVIAKLEARNIAFELGAKNTVDLLRYAALACTANHATFHRMGWHSEMINGHAHWIPPSWIDPEHRPRRNRLHD